MEPPHTIPTVSSAETIPAAWAKLGCPQEMEGKSLSGSPSKGAGSVVSEDKRSIPRYSRWRSCHVSPALAFPRQLQITTELTSRGRNAMEMELRIARGRRTCPQEDNV